MEKTQTKKSHATVPLIVPRVLFLRNCQRLRRAVHEKINFRVLIPRNPEFPGIVTCVVPTFTTTSPARRDILQLWFICTCIGLWVQAKWGQLLVKSWKYFHENLRENANFFKNILGFCPRDLVLLIHAKTRVWNAHATVPLTAKICYGLRVKCKNLQKWSIPSKIYNLQDSGVSSKTLVHWSFKAFLSPTPKFGLS